jgi:hypothetical protein
MPQLLPPSKTIAPPQIKQQPLQNNDYGIFESVEITIRREQI